MIAAITPPQLIPSLKRNVICQNYSFVQILGKGQFGEVSLVRDMRSQNLNCCFAKKTVDFCNYIQQRDKVLFEAEVLKRFDHPNITRLHDSFVDEENSDFVMILEYCEGGDLESLIQSYRESGVIIPEEKVVSLMKDLAKALTCVHSHGIIHRDIKPSNILLRNDEAVLADFGTSIEVCKEKPLATSYGGTPRYMSSEMQRHMPYRNNTDIWSFGCVMCELMTVPSPNATGYQNTITRLNASSYSPQLIYLVKSMLTEKADSRPTIWEIASNALLNIAENIESIIPASPVIKSDHLSAILTELHPLDETIDDSKKRNYAFGNDDYSSVFKTFFGKALLNVAVLTDFSVENFCETHQLQHDDKIRKDTFNFVLDSCHLGLSCEETDRLMSQFDPKLDLQWCDITDMNNEYIQYFSGLILWVEAYLPFSDTPVSRDVPVVSVHDFVNYCVDKISSEGLRVVLIEFYNDMTNEILHAILSCLNKDYNGNIMIHETTKLSAASRKIRAGKSVDTIERLHPNSTYSTADC